MTAKQKHLLRYVKRHLRDLSWELNDACIARVHRGPVHKGCFGFGAVFGSAGIAVMTRHKPLGFFAVALALVFFHTSLTMNALGHCKECYEHTNNVYNLTRSIYAVHSVVSENK